MAAIWAHVSLLVDIWSMKVFVWVLGRNGELLDSHLFFFDRYSDLADYHRLKGRTAKAERLAAIAEAHYQAAPDDDEPPEAAAMAMPVPRPPVITNAVSTTRMTKPPVGRTVGRRQGEEGRCYGVITRSRPSAPSNFTLVVVGLAAVVRRRATTCTPGSVESS